MVLIIHNGQEVTIFIHIKHHIQDINEMAVFNLYYTSNKITYMT